MSEYLYPAIFHSNTDGSYTVTFPDLPGCVSEGKSLANAVAMAESALYEWIEYLSDKNAEIPPASESASVKFSDNEFVNLIYAELKDNKAVKRTVSLPRWLDEQAAASGLSLSRVLQDALRSRFS